MNGCGGFALVIRKLSLNSLRIVGDNCCPTLNTTLAPPCATKVDPQDVFQETAVSALHALPQTDLSSATPRLALPDRRATHH